MIQLLQLEGFDTKEKQRYLVAKSISPEEKQRSLSTTSKNIFTDIYDDYNLQKRPKFSPSGEIIQHSILGKSEWFNRIKNGRRLQFDEIAKNQLPVTKGVLRGDSKAQKRTIPTSDVKSQKLTGSGKSKKNFNQLTTKNQLLEELNKIKQRIDFNKKADQIKIDQLEPELKRLLTKDMRVLSQHEKNEQYWHYFAQHQGNLVGRDELSSQLYQQEKYKIKNDTAKVFDTLNTDFERISPKDWQLNLRKTKRHKFEKIVLRGREIIVDETKKQDFIVGADLPRAFSEKSTIGHTLEYVLKPDFTNNEERLAFKSFKSDQYLFKRLNETQDYFNQTYMLSLDKRTEYDKLIVQGKSQFEIEKQMLLMDGTDNTGVYRKDTEKPPDDFIKEQVYEQSYTNKVKLTLPQIGKMKAKKLGSQTQKSEESNLSFDWKTENLYQI